MDKLIHLTTEINEIAEQNKNFTKRNDLSNDIKTTSSNLSELKVTITDDICSQINTSMSSLNKKFIQMVVGHLTLTFMVIDIHLILMETLEQVLLLQA